VGSTRVNNTLDGWAGSAECASVECWVESDSVEGRMTIVFDRVGLMTPFSQLPREPAGVGAHF
jgi:hypothetical protein